MAIVTSDLKTLPTNKTVVFYSPLEGEDILVRTGMLEDKCNFLHAVLYSYSSDYVNMNEMERKRFVKRLRASMAGIIDQNNWRKNALLCHSLFSVSLENVIEEIYNYLENDEECSGKVSKKIIKELIEPKKDIYKLIVKFLPGEKILNDTLPNILSNTQELAIKPLSRVILDNITDLLITHPTIVKAKKEKISYIVKKLKMLYKLVFSLCENYAFQKYIKELEKQSETVDDFCMDFATEKFERNIFFINKDRLPETKFQKYNNYNRKCIIVLKLDENHYEIIGKLLPDNYVQREFDFNDPIIKNIKSYYENKEIVPVESSEEIVEFDASGDEKSEEIVEFEASEDEKSEEEFYSDSDTD